jgi:hypothetical protein
VFCSRNATVVALRARQDGLAVQPLPLPRTAGDTLDVAPDGSRMAFLRYPAGRIRCDIYSPVDGALGRTVTGNQVSFDWGRDRMAWSSAGAIRFASISGTEPAQTVALEGSRAGEFLSFLSDGRLLLGREPTALLDLDRIGPPGARPFVSPETVKGCSARPGDEPPGCPCAEARDLSKARRPPGRSCVGTRWRTSPRTTQRASKPSCWRSPPGARDRASSFASPRDSGPWAGRRTDEAF